MAKFELPIYGENDEVIKRHATNICPWGIFIQAANMADEMKNRSANEQLEAVGEILKAVFHGLTDEELMAADAFDVMNTFQQIVSGGQKIKGGSSKNA